MERLDLTRPAAARAARGGARLVVAAACLAGSAAWAACDAPWLAVAAGVEDSRWQETSAQGLRLVDEQGTLGTLMLSLGGRCRDIDWSARLTHARGDRDYEGLTSTHVPVATNSRISQWGIEISGLAPVAAGWAAGGRIGLHRIDRDIASAGRAQGYPERFRFGELALGARLALADSPGLRLAALAWLGAGPAGRMTLQLPNADAAELRLGGSRSLALELLALGAAGVPGWHWQARLGHRREQWAAGPAQVITRQGIPVAGAVQPATRQSTLDLQAGLRFDF